MKSCTRFTWKNICFLLLWQSYPMRFFQQEIENDKTQSWPAQSLDLNPWKPLEYDQEEDGWPQASNKAIKLNFCSRNGIKSQEESKSLMESMQDDFWTLPFPLFEVWKHFNQPVLFYWNLGEMFSVVYIKISNKYILLKHIPKIVYPEKLVIFSLNFSRAVYVCACVHL